MSSTDDIGNSVNESFRVQTLTHQGFELRAIPCGGVTRCGPVSFLHIFGFAKDPAMDLERFSRDLRELMDRYKVTLETR